MRGEDVPYVLGLPLVGGQPFFPHNYTHQDASVSRLLIHYLANFARKGCVFLFCSHGALWGHQPGPVSVSTPQSAQTEFVNTGTKTAVIIYYSDRQMRDILTVMSVS